jgi:hypothetical protein
MIEKKISYNEPKPTKVSNIKPVKQGGRLNYLGKQKTITAPVKWKSGPTHPITHLAYITDEEQKILVDLNIYKSMNGKPNKGPFGIASLNDGDGSGGGGSGSDGAGAGDSGGSGGGASASGGGGDDGAGASSAGDAGGATGDSGGVGGSGGGPGADGGSGPGGEAGTGGVDSAAAAASQAASDAANAVGTIGQEAAEAAGIGPSVSAPASTTTGVMSTLSNMARAAINAYANISPVGIAISAINNAISNAQKGVTAPDDFSQTTESVQSSAPSSSNGGGITTIQSYAPLTNSSSGDNTYDAMRIRLENLLNRGRI